MVSFQEWAVNSRSPMIRVVTRLNNPILWSTYRLYHERISLLLLCIICASCGCDSTQPTEIIVVETPEERKWDAYAVCPQIDAQYKLDFTVRDSHGELHSDTFYLRVISIRGETYRYHNGGVTAADGPDGGFNKSCYIENGTATSVAVRFWLSSRRDGYSELELNELVWATTGLRTSVELPHDCHATFTFVKLGTNQSAGNHPLQPGNKASRTEMDDPSSLPAGR